MKDERRGKIITKSKQLPQKHTVIEKVITHY